MTTTPEIHTQTPEIHTPVTSEEIAHVFDEAPPPADLSGYGIEDWVTLAVFWLMVACVVAQFFTRYVLNNSLAWTEEIAIYALVVVVFLGSSLCVRASRHIQVDFLYRYLPKSAGRLLSTLVDIVRIGFEVVWPKNRPREAPFAAFERHLRAVAPKVARGLARS